MEYSEFINRSRNLYEKIFDEKIEDSIEYIIFAKGNPHPLRIKIEDELAKTQEEFSKQINAFNSGAITFKLLKKRDDLKDLDKILMEYIEEHIS